MSGNIKKIVEPNSGIDYSLEKDFKIFTLSKELPITTYPSYIRLGIVIYCVKGNAKIDIYSNKHIITPKELIIILPGQLVALTDVSVDFQIRYFTITESFYSDILSGISRFSPHFFFYMRQHYYFKMEDVETLSFVDFFELLIRKAVDPENQTKLFETIDMVRENQTMRVATGVLNEIITEATALQQPPADKGKRLKIYYTTQVAVKPPTFVNFVNDKELMHFSYVRYLENRIREAFGFRGTALKFITRERSGKDAE